MGSSQIYTGSAACIPSPGGKKSSLWCATGRGPLTEDDGVGEGIAGHEVGLGRAGHSAEHLALAHRVLACRQFDHLGRCTAPAQPLSLLCLPEQKL